MKLFVLLLLFMVAGFGGFFLGYSGPSNHLPTLPTGLRVDTYPITMTVRLVDRWTFENSTEVRSIQLTQGYGGSVVQAYTKTWANPCEITIPADFRISVIEERGEAWFSDPETARILAHEMLHCLYGSWHKPWNQIWSPPNPASPGANASQR